MEDFSLSGFEIYLVTQKGLSRSSIQKTIDNIKRLKTHGALSDREAFTSFSYQILTTKSKAYYNKYVQAIQHYCGFKGLDWAKDIPYMKEDERTRDAFSDEEVEKFLGVKTSWDLFWLFCCYTGCRPIEGRKIRLEDINLANKTILMRNTKTQKDRSIPISPVLYPALYTYCQTHPGGYLFYYRDPQKMLSNVSYLTDFHVRCEKVGIKGKKPYSFRHSFVTRHLQDAENPLFVVQDIVGHSDPKTTRRYYHGNLKAMRKAIARDPLGKEGVSPQEAFRNLIEDVLPKVQGLPGIRYQLTSEKLEVFLG